MNYIILYNKITVTEWQNDRNDQNNRGSSPQLAPPPICPHRSGLTGPHQCIYSCTRPLVHYISPDLLCAWYIVCAQLLFYEFLKDETKLSYVVLVGQGLRPTTRWRI